MCRFSARWVEARFFGSVSEPIQFISSVGAEDAVIVRLWDDLATVRDKKCSELGDFRAGINELAI